MVFGWMLLCAQTTDSYGFTRKKKLFSWSLQKKYSFGVNADSAFSKFDPKL